MEAAHAARQRCIDERVEGLVVQDLEHPRLLLRGRADVASHEVLEGLECSGILA